MKITEESLREQDHPRSLPKEPTQEESKSEREKLRSMSKKDRLWYIWTYYKLHIAGVFLAIGIVWSIGSVMYQKSFDTVLYCMYLNNRSEPELNAAPLEQGFSAYLGLGKKELITSESSYISFGDNATEYSYASLAKITALVASKELDIIIGDREAMDHYASMDGLMDLEAELPEDTLDIVRNHLIYSVDSDGAEHACGVSLADTWFALESNLGQNPPIFSIISNSTHKDAAAALLQYIFGR